MMSCLELRTPRGFRSTASHVCGTLLAACLIYMLRPFRKLLDIGGTLAHYSLLNDQTLDICIYIFLILSIVFNVKV